MKNIIKIILIKISRIIYHIIPWELKNKKEPLYSKLKDNLINKTLLHLIIIS